MSTARWQLGDVIVWFQTGTEQDAKTDSDVYLNFYNDSGDLIGWVQAYERGDLAGFEEGDINCGYLGNVNRLPWLKTLLNDGTQLGVRIENVSDDRPEWFVERISLDFRIGPKEGDSTARHWDIGTWINPGEEERLFNCNALAEAIGDGFENVGFDKELEIQAGDPSESPQD